MRLPVSLLLAAALLAPTTASAATIGGKTRERDGTTFGVMHYRSGHGVANRVTVAWVTKFGEVRVTDTAERLDANGACRQAGRHSAICPWTESGPSLEIVVGSRADRVEIKGPSALVRGGGGNDVLTGNGDELFGDRGNDILRGGRGWDRLHGGPGRDRIDGRGGSRYLADYFYDDETDAQAARDVYVGGRNARARLSYEKRRRGLKIDLHDTEIGPEQDLIRDVKGLVGGHGRDVLIGTGGVNFLEGGPGRDRLHGRGGPDVLYGNAGPDTLYGEDGDDDLREGSYAGTPGPGDRLIGGRGSDNMQSVDTIRTEGKRPDEVVCDRRDRPVESDAADRLRGCAKIAGWDIAQFEMPTRPVLTDEGARFTLKCSDTENEQIDPSTTVRRCRGRLSIRSVAGTEYGHRDFEHQFAPGEFDSPQLAVTVPLSGAGREAILGGAVVEVEAEAFSSNGYDFPAAGFRAPLD